MNTRSNLVASFSQDVHEFAFQANISQKNVVDIYPLDALNNYVVNSSLVSHIDYEINDLKAAEVIFLGWCSASNKETSQKVKRKHGDDSNHVDNASRTENFFVNGFPQGKIVVYSSSGKQIVNIIQTKKEILHADTEGAYIWILDSDKVVKKLQYNQTKPLKTFHLTDGKEEDIILFHLITAGTEVYLSIATRESLYIVDPSKRRPVTVANYDISGCIACEILEEGKQIVVATKEKIAVYDFVSGNLVQTWAAQIENLKVIKNVIMSIDRFGEICGYKVGEETNICTIRIANAEALQIIQIADSLMIAWLNVNEPNFKTISLGDINGNREIVINDQKKTLADKAIVIANESKDKGENEKLSDKHSRKKITRAEQDELSQSLVAALEFGGKESDILSIIQSDSWTEPRTKSFIARHSLNEDSTHKLFEIIIAKLQRNPWEENDILSTWLKWLLTLRGAYSSSSLKRSDRKQMKNLKSSLKSSGETLPILLGIQGRLEMLKSQAQLREELVQLSVTENEVEVESIENEDVRGELIDSDGHEESISYANGESDTFVDASEY